MFLGRIYNTQSDKMNSIKRTTPKSIRRYHKSCTLETITEEKESEKILKDTMKRGAIRKTSDNNFTPFLSSWASKGIKTQKIATTMDTESERNLRQFESVNNDYKKLFELTRSSGKIQNLLSRIEELEEECTNLRYKTEETVERLAVEQKTSEQMKIDYEFMLEIQNKTFKRRERELLEQIDKSTRKIDKYTQTTIENGSSQSTVNAFEFEEISEKLNSFEKQNKYLQNSNDTLESQNRILKKTIEEMKQISACQKSQQNKKEISNESNTKWNGDLTEMQRELRSACNSLPNAINIPKNATIQQQSFSSNNEIKFALLELQNVIKLISEKEHSISTHSKHNTESYAAQDTTYQKNNTKINKKLKTEFNNSNQDILNLLLSQINSILYNIEENKSEIKLKEHVAFEKDNYRTDEDRNKNMNLSDAEKINHSHIFTINSKKSDVQNFELSAKNVIPSNENYTNSIKETLCTFISKKNEDTQNIKRKYEELTETIEKLNKDKNSKYIEYQKLENLLKEREETIRIMTNEQIKNINGQKRSSERNRHLKCLINYQEVELNKLCSLFITKTNKNQEIDTVIKKNQSSKRENQSIISDEHIGTNDQQFRTEKFDSKILMLKKEMTQLKDKNEKLREAILKINNYRQDMKDIFSNLKHTLTEEISGKMQALKFDIQETKNTFHEKIKLIHTAHKLKTEEPVINIAHRTDVELFNKNIQKNNIVEVTKEQHVKEPKQYFQTKKCPNHLDPDFRERTKGEINTRDLIIEESKMSQFNNDDKSVANLNKIFQTWDFNLKEDNTRNKIDSSIQGRNIEPLIVDEYKKEDKWKLLRTRVHDSRRNIDSDDIF